METLGVATRKSPGNLWTFPRPHLKVSIKLFCTRLGKDRPLLNASAYLLCFIYETVGRTLEGQFTAHYFMSTRQRKSRARNPSPGIARPNPNAVFPRLQATCPFPQSITIFPIHPQLKYLHRQYQSKSSTPQTQRNKYIDSGNAQITRRHGNGDIVSVPRRPPRNLWTLYQPVWEF